MRNRTIVILAIVCACLMVAANMSIKKWPTEKERTRTARTFRSPQQWKERFPPDFELKLLDESTFKLSEQVGKRAIIINFFATWCGPCRKEMPEFVRMHREYGRKDVLVLAVDADEKLATVEKFVKEYGISFSVGIDRSDVIGELYNVRSFPTTVFIGADGRIKLYKIGQIVNADAAFKSLIEESMKQIESGEGISAEEYLAGLEAQEPMEDPYDYEDEPEEDEKEKLDGRALDIAKKMTCSCGCEDKVDKCKCSTAKSIRKKLAEGEFEGKSDEEIIKELNREFCVGDD
ncbi:MAG: redoxin domain-containing protein [Thermodesulfovibrionales bacterium]|nr:redoxin domain-containing protein [Thermodesulfovibrionales bacterium]